MKNDLLSMSQLALLFLSLFVLSEILYHRFRIKAEYSRKLSHIGTGLICLLFPILLHSHWSVLTLCATFTLLLLLSIKFNLLQSIHAVDRKSVGSLMYPAAVYLCFLFQSYQENALIFYYLPLLILAICDPLAALSGKKWPFGPYRVLGAKKTLLGSIVFFLAAVVINLLLWELMHDLPWDAQQLMIIAIIALATTLAEALSRDGYDNLTIPIAAILCLSILA
ncbi:phosphatidate cytidylyltransferase [Sphingobacterium sp.]|uniref:diacylglycerol/polyprenol kinase family protein n=1 Tax=Sphingobacterium sp. TaxID=341027 RepID=UPI00289D44BE|nr:phosphatidate cytidylyltransferase [Sphingobacterium sp.]